MNDVTCLICSCLKSVPPYIAVPCVLSGEELDSKESPSQASCHHQASQKPKGNPSMLPGIDEIGGCEQTTQHMNRFQVHVWTIIHHDTCRELLTSGSGRTGSLQKHFGPVDSETSSWPTDRILTNNLPSILMARMYECTSFVGKLGSDRLCTILARQARVMAQWMAELNLIRERVSRGMAVASRSCQSRGLLRLQGHRRGLGGETEFRHMAQLQDGNDRLVSVAS
ncbi:hypothetical protein B0I37DRAFT_189214 [Chaetomium sp. MPI-CAGE-AT-0009]|nr:hypothetical protein B0I37DRAFT_189214 [Chaetomium sp. MPI-CAGE-AT-0009]